MLTIDEGRRAVALARETLTAYIDRKERIKPEGLPPSFGEKAGVFVTLHEDGDLRGEGNHLFNMSLSLHALGQKEKAVSFARSALAIFEEIESPHAKTVRKKLAEWGG